MNHVTTKPPAVPTHLYIKVFVIHDAIAHISALGLYHTPRREARYHCNSVINLLLCDVNIHEVVASVLGFSPGISLYLFNTHSHIGYLKMSKEALNQSRM